MEGHTRAPLKDLLEHVLLMAAPTNEGKAERTVRRLQTMLKVTRICGAKWKH